MGTTTLIGIFLALLVLYILRKITRGSPTKEKRNMTGQVIIITGSSAGIGKETARSLVKSGAKVIFATRDEQKTKNVISQILQSSPNVLPENAIFEKLNLSSLQSVLDFTKNIKSKYDKIDILINNAGVANDKFIRTEDGLESVWQINHISHTILTALLLDLLKNSNDARIINVSSMAHVFAKYSDEFFRFEENSYPIMNSYNVSKLANVFLTYKLKEFCHDEKINAKLNDFKNIKSVCVHPGAVYTEISRPEERTWYYRIFLYAIFIPLMILFFRNEEMGAQTTLHCCYVKKEELVDGGYYDSNKMVIPGKTTKNEKFKNKINEITYKCITESKIYQQGSKISDTFKNFIECFKLNPELNMDNSTKKED
jgi:retinol dehydrogenase 12